MTKAPFSVLASLLALYAALPASAQSVGELGCYIYMFILCPSVIIDHDRVHGHVCWVQGWAVSCG